MCPPNFYDTQSRLGSLEAKADNVQASISYMQNNIDKLTGTVNKNAEQVTILANWMTQQKERDKIKKKEISRLTLLFVSIGTSIVSGTIIGLIIRFV